jgi:predicted O-methyltransferase YrrM
VDWSGPVDFIFFDGDHTDEGVGRDWSDWSPHIAPGGLAAFHDSVAPEGTPGPPALVRKIQSSDPGFCVVCQVDSLTIFQRLPEGVP